MTARSVRQILKGVSASLQGKTRGPDHDPEGKRRTPHRDSYDVEDARAKPWRPIGDGSVGQGIAHREALIQTAKELFQQLWREYPLAEVREARQRHAALFSIFNALFREKPFGNRFWENRAVATRAISAYSPAVSLRVPNRE